MTINKKNNEEKEEMPITKVNNRSQEIYDHQGQTSRATDEKKMMTITRANFKS
jgi:hypothetical protein